MTTHSKKLFTAILVLNLILIGVYLSMFLLIKFKNEKTMAALADIELQTEKVKRLSTAKRIVERAEAEAEKLNSFGVGGVDSQVNFIAFLESLGEEKKIDVEVKNPWIEKRESSKEKDYFQMEVIAIGTWNNLMNYYFLVEEVPMDITINRVRFKVNEKSLEEYLKVATTTPQWQANMELKVLKFKDKK